MWAAPVCSTWTFIGRATTKRNRLNPAGCSHNNRVRHANRMVICVVILFLCAHARGVHLWLEQPSSTLMDHFSPMMECVRWCLKHKQLVWLSAYGAASSKPLTIWSSSNKVSALSRSKPRSSGPSELFVRGKNGRVTGRQKVLKQSAAYPPAFGHAVAQTMVLVSKGIPK